MQVNKERNRPPWAPTKGAHARKVDMSALYNSTRWRKDRAAYMQLNPICVQCEMNGIMTPASVCDHVTPVLDGGDVWDWSNRQALCTTCHAIKSGKEAHTRGKGGVNI